MSDLNIWHHAAGPTPDAVNGVAQTVWALGAEQARRGHRVVFLADGSKRQITDAEAMGIRLLPIESAMAGPRPDILHLHSVFIPVQAKLAMWAKRHSVPYIVSPHGAVAPQTLGRGKLKKSVYSALIERPRFRHAAAATAVLDAELQEIRDFAGDRLPAFSVSNALNPAPTDMPLIDCEDVVFLGRLDVEQKGLDRLATFAEAMPDLTFGIYGPARTGTSLPAFPSNVTLHEPVWGERKWSVLRSAAVYMQLARWEAFGLSIFEAALVGTPPVVSQEMHVAPLVEHWGGLVIDGDRPADGVGKLRSLVRSRIGRTPLPEIALAAAALVHPGTVADRVDGVYDFVLRRP
ncbi:glycosyltransferase [Pseudarthrobacter sp. H2]|uniref:glycosyltransferase n=1 Tax=Pseudarthrobacter sp. H2 TaxID=3418415 RepID=UPI003CF3425B